ncbi:YhcU family protein [Bacillus carboniphilus]|uniref:YhcU family protein n=1 Tax=Bacillus carboniphilus TaxID=86663 RepID=A0ABN0W7K6_9BACI
MKIVYASTKEQEEKIEELVEQIYSEIFPQYFLDEEIKNFEGLNVLHMTKSNTEYVGTLKEAFKVISSLQTIISILEVQNRVDVDEKYQDIFDENVRILQNYGLIFPFTFHHFQTTKTSENDFSTYVKPANELLI